MAAKKPEKKKEAKKPAPKKAEPKKKPEAKKPAPKKKADPKEGKRVYHVVKRDDGMWEVKFAGGSKAIKLFKTQKEAVAYTKEMADNQDGAMLVHNSKGSNKGKIKKK